MEAPALVFYTLLALAALAVGIALLYPQLTHTGVEQPPALELHVLRVADINGTVHITVLLEPREPVWLTRWCLGGHCYVHQMPVVQAAIEDLIDVDHAYNPGTKLIICYRETWKTPARCVSLRLP